MRGAILAFVLGVCCLQQIPQLPDRYWAILLPLMLLPVWVLPRRLELCKKFFLLVFFAGLGFFWATLVAQLRLSDALSHEWEGRDIQLVGVVASLPQVQERGERFLFDVEQVETANAQVPQHISITRYFARYRDPAPHSAESEFHPGERWRLTVRLKRPHGSYNPQGFDFEAWALERNIRATGYIRKSPDNARLQQLVYQPGYLVERVREQVRQRFQSVMLDAPYAGVLLALVIGDDDAISDTDWETFRRTGVVHLMSISGLHVTMVAGLAFALVFALWRRVEWLALRLPARKAAVLSGLVAAGIYSLVAGYAVPTQRTFYMLAVVAAALWSGRTVSFSLVLCWALLVVVLIDPWAVLAPGFWLSFGAVAMLGYAGSNRIVRPGWLREATHAQWVVTIGLAPLLLILFQQVSIISPLANAFAIPLISLVVTPLALLGAAIPFEFILHTAHAVMAWCMWLLQACADLPVAVWQQHAPPVWTVLTAILGVLWLLLPRGFPVRWLGGVALLPMFLLLPAQPLPGELRVAILDVGQGLAVVVHTAKHALLYDAGPRYSDEADSGNRIILPYLQRSGISRLDGLVITHDDVDHTGGAGSVIQGIPIAWLASPLPANNPLSGVVARHVRCFAGQSWLWDGVQFDMLHPIWESYSTERLKDNDRSCVLKISSPYGSLLLTGDIERVSEMELLERDEASISADVLVAPHHGSKTSSTQPFVASVNPKVTVFTVGYRNRFGHPKPEVMERYRLLDSAIYRSDTDGAVLVDFAERQGVTVRAWRREQPRYWQNAEWIAEP